MPKASLAKRQRNLRMKNQGLPRPKLTRTEALNALANQIELLPAGPEKAALLARYVEQRRRRTTRIKHVSDRSTPTPPAVEEEHKGLTAEELATPTASPSTCVRCKNRYVWNGINDPQLCADCLPKWVEENRVLAEQQRSQGWGA